MAAMRLRTVLLVALLLAAVSATSVASAAPVRRFSNPEFASGGLIVKGVSCIAATRVIHRALKKPGCTPRPADAALGRGCYASTRVNGWACKGLFPGEGYDLKCRKGARRIHGSAGG